MSLLKRPQPNPTNTTNAGEQQQIKRQRLSESSGSLTSLISSTAPSTTAPATAPSTTVTANHTPTNTPRVTPLAHTATPFKTTLPLPAPPLPAAPTSSLGQSTTLGATATTAGPTGGAVSTTAPLSTTALAPPTHTALFSNIPSTSSTTTLPSVSSIGQPISMTHPILPVPLGGLGSNNSSAQSSFLPPFTNPSAASSMIHTGSTVASTNPLLASTVLGAVKPSTTTPLISMNPNPSPLVCSTLGPLNHSAATLPHAAAPGAGNSATASSAAPTLNSSSSFLLLNSASNLTTANTASTSSASGSSLFSSLNNLSAPSDTGGFLHGSSFTSHHSLPPTGSLIFPPLSAAGLNTSTGTTGIPNTTTNSSSASSLLCNLNTSSGSNPITASSTLPLNASNASTTSGPLSSFPSALPTTSSNPLLLGAASTSMNSMSNFLKTPAGPGGTTTTTVGSSTIPSTGGASKLSTNANSASVRSLTATFLQPPGQTSQAQAPPAQPAPAAAPLLYDIGSMQTQWLPNSSSNPTQSSNTSTSSLNNPLHSSGPSSSSLSLAGGQSSTIARFGTGSYPQETITPDASFNDLSSAASSGPSAALSTTARANAGSSSTSAAAAPLNTSLNTSSSRPKRDRDDYFEMPWSSTSAVAPRTRTTRASAAAALNNPRANELGSELGFEDPSELDRFISPPVNSEGLYDLSDDEVARAVTYARDSISSIQRRGAASTAGARALSPRAIDVLREYLFDHFRNPYPSPPELNQLSAQTGLSLQQTNYFFVNARVRIYKPAIRRVLAEKSKAQTQYLSRGDRTDRHNTRSTTNSLNNNHHSAL